MPLKTMAIELNTTPTPNLHAFPLTQTIWERGLAMISYFQAVRELDTRWTGSLQFLPPTPTLRNEHDCIVARQIASTEIDLFHRYAREIAAANGLKLGLLVDLYDIMLSTGLMLDDELYEGRSVWRQSPAPKRAPSSSASKPNRMNRRLHRTQHHRQ